MTRSVNCSDRFCLSRRNRCILDTTRGGNEPNSQPTPVRRAFRRIVYDFENFDESPIRLTKRKSYLELRIEPTVPKSYRLTSRKVSNYPLRFASVNGSRFSSVIVKQLKSGPCQQL